MSHFCSIVSTNFWLVARHCVTLSCATFCCFPLKQYWALYHRQLSSLQSRWSLGGLFLSFVRAGLENVLRLVQPSYSIILLGTYLIHRVSYKASLFGMQNSSSLSLPKSGSYSSYSYQVILWLDNGSTSQHSATNSRSPLCKFLELFFGITTTSPILLYCSPHS